MRVLLILIMAVLLTGCFGLFARPDPEPPVVFREVQVEIFQPPLPAPMQLEPVRWFVLTRDNADEKMAEIERFTGMNFVIFGMVPRSYENSAWNLQETRRYLRQLEAMILYYQEATTSPAGTTPEEWLEFNRQQQNQTDPN